MFKKFYHKNTFAVKFLASYMLMLLIPSAFGLTACIKMGQEINRKEMQSNLQMVVQTKNILDERIQAIELLTLQVSMSSEILNAINSATNGLSDKNMYPIFEFYKSLDVYSLSDNVVSDMFFLFPDSNVVVSFEGTSTMDFFFNQNIHYNDMKPDEIKNLLLDHLYYNSFLPSVPITINNKKSNEMLYLMSLPVGSSYQKAVAFATIDVDKLLGIQNNDANLLETNISIYDKSRKLFLCNSNGDNNLPSSAIEDLNGSGYFSLNTQKGKQLLISYSSSTNNDWVYCVSILQKSVTKDASRIQNMLLMFTGIMMLIGLLIAVILSYRSAKPLRKITDMLRGESFAKESFPKDFNFINDAILDITHERQALKSQISEQLPILTNAFLDKLLHGKIAGTDYEHYKKLIGIKLDANEYFVAILHMNNAVDGSNQLEKIHMLKYFISEKIEKSNAFRVYTTENSSNSLALIFCWNLEGQSFSADNLQEYLNQILNCVSEEYRDCLKFYIGNIYQNLLDVSLSFADASQAQEIASMMQEKQQFVWYSKIIYRSSNYFYPMDIESRLISITRSGNMTDTVTLLNNIYKENFVNRTLSTEIMQLLINEMKGTVYKILSNSNVDIVFSDNITGMVSKVQLQSSEKNAWIDLTDIFELICKKNNEKKRFVNKVNAENLIVYVQKNYANTELSLTFLADYFYVREETASNCIKLYIGMRFFDYLEKIRMEKACEFLSTNKTVDEISEAVGYTNVRSFYRAFKRFTGVTPSEYKNQQSK